MNQPVMQPIPGSAGLWELAEDYAVTLPDSGKSLLIKAGFQTDGASIPRELWSVVGASPFDPDVIGPSVVHDALYEAELLQRSSCDTEFQKLLQVNSTRAAGFAVEFYDAVRIFGGAVWRQHTPDSIAAARQYCILS
jgi:Protein of unknown function (DUF1353)